jgi:hypothetical protein
MPIFAFSINEICPKCKADILYKQLCDTFSERGAPANFHIRCPSCSCDISVWAQFIPSFQLSDAEQAVGAAGASPTEDDGTNAAITPDGAKGVR